MREREKAEEQSQPDKGSPGHPGQRQPGIAGSRPPTPGTPTPAMPGCPPPGARHSRPGAPPVALTAAAVPHIPTDEVKLLHLGSRFAPLPAGMFPGLPLRLCGPHPRAQGPGGGVRCPHTPRQPPPQNRGGSRRGWGAGPRHRGSRGAPRTCGDGGHGGDTGGQRRSPFIQSTTWLGDHLLTGSIMRAMGGFGGAGLERPPLSGRGARLCGAPGPRCAEPGLAPEEKDDEEEDEESR